MSPTVATTRIAAGLRAQALDHGGRRVDTVHVEPSLGQRDGELARADAELEDRPPPLIAWRNSTAASPSASIGYHSS